MIKVVVITNLDNGYSIMDIKDVSDLYIIVSEKVTYENIIKKIEALKEATFHKEINGTPLIVKAKDTHSIFINMVDMMQKIYKKHSKIDEEKSHVSSKISIDILAGDEIITLASYYACLMLREKQDKELKMHISINFIPKDSKIREKLPAKIFNFDALDKRKKLILITLFIKGKSGPIPFYDIYSSLISNDEKEIISFSIIPSLKNEYKEVLDIIEKKTDKLTHMWLRHPIDILEKEGWIEYNKKQRRYLLSKRSEYFVEQKWSERIKEMINEFIKIYDVEMDIYFYTLYSYYHTIPNKITDYKKYMDLYEEYSKAKVIEYLNKKYNISEDTANKYWLKLEDLLRNLRKVHFLNIHDKNYRINDLFWDKEILRQSLEDNISYDILSNIMANIRKDFQQQDQTNTAKTLAIVYKYVPQRIKDVEKEGENRKKRLEMNGRNGSGVKGWLPDFFEDLHRYNNDPGKWVKLYWDVYEDYISSEQFVDGLLKLSICYWGPMTIGIRQIGDYQYEPYRAGNDRINIPKYIFYAIEQDGKLKNKIDNFLSKDQESRFQKWVEKYSGKEI